jgi:hypothetical protein
VPYVVKRSRWPRESCSVCDGAGYLSGSFVFARDPACTCGAGPLDELTLHDVACDAVPCPFDQLLSNVYVRGR